MALCGIINSNLLVDCVNPLIGGVKDILYIINYDDLSSYTIDGNGVITNIQLLSGKNAYYIEGQRSSIDVKSIMNAGKYISNYTHEVVFRVFKNDAETKKQLEALANGKFIFIVENNFRGTNNASSFEVLGLNAGLKASSKESNKSDSDTQGAWVITASSSDIKEPFLPRFIYNTNYAQTKAIIEALISAPTIPSNALLGEDGQPILNEDGNYILNE